MSRTGLKRKGMLSVIGGILLVFGLFSFSNNDFKITKNLDIFFTLFREINLYYVDEVDPETLVKESISGMLEKLDPYTTYIPEEDMEDYKFMTTGEYGGIGSIIRRSGEYAIIADPYEGYPAQLAGLKAGDVIQKIDGKSIKGLKLEKVSERLKGVPKSEIKIEVKRPGVKKNLEFKFKRKVIKISNVPYAGMLTNETGYVLLRSFTVGAGAEVRTAVENLVKEKGAKNIILDLRGNPGGLLGEAVNISNIFVPKGQEIVRTKGKMKHWNAVYRAENAPFDTEIPVVVLVNRGSASASEIVSGSIQDLDRGVVVGNRTYGKGLVQATRNLSYNTKLKVTTAKYYIPSGRCIQALDYSHRNEDGSVGHIPDSLISEFKTKNGRTVKDGGGILPDIDVDTEILSRIAFSLYAKNLFFDYATEYAVEHKEIAKASDFDISDEEFEKFKKWLEGKDFDYKTHTEEKLKDLIKMAKRERYFKKAEEAIDALKADLAHDKFKDLDLFKDEVKRMLRDEIVSRYYYQKGSIEAGLKDDVQLKRAIEIIEDKALYESILKGEYKEEKKKEKDELVQNTNQQLPEMEIDLI